MEKTQYETWTRNYECKRCMTCLCKISFFFEGLIKVKCKRCNVTWFRLKTIKILQSVPFSKGKNKTKEKVLNKSKSLVKIFEVGILGVLSYKVRSSVMFTKNLSKSFDEKKVFMNGCMYA